MSDIKKLKKEITTVLDRRITVSGPNMEWVRGYVAGQTKMKEAIKAILERNQ